MQRCETRQQAEKRNICELQEGDIDHDHRPQRQGEMAHVFVMRQRRWQGDEGHIDQMSVLRRVGRKCGFLMNTE